MNTNPQLQRIIGPVSDLELFDGTVEMQGHGRYLPGVSVPITRRQATHYHVGVTDGLHFVNVVVLNDRVEGRVEVVQKVNHLEKTDIVEIDEDTKECKLIQIYRSNVIACILKQQVNSHKLLTLRKHVNLNR